MISGASGVLPVRGKGMMRAGLQGYRIGNPVRLPPPQPGGLEYR
jgi:hypothetical protein